MQPTTSTTVSSQVPIVNLTEDEVKEKKLRIEAEAKAKEVKVRQVKHKARYDLVKKIKRNCEILYVMPSPGYYGAVLLGAIPLIRKKPNATSALVLGLLTARQVDYFTAESIKNAKNLANVMGQRQGSKMFDELAEFNEETKKYELKTGKFIDSTLFPLSDISEKYTVDHSSLLHSKIEEKQTSDPYVTSAGGVMVCNLL